MTADAGLLKKRIYCSSKYELKPSNEKAMIDSFVERAYLFNEYVALSLQSSGQAALAVNTTSTANDIENQVLKVISSE